MNTSRPRRLIVLAALAGGMTCAQTWAQTGTAGRMIWPKGVGYRTIEPQKPKARRVAATGGKAAAGVPWGYVKVAGECGIPAWALYGIALQESQMKFGQRALPYPWTLCVQGRPERYSSHAQTLTALKGHLAAGIRNVDCGSMQVNWKWHAQRFDSEADALHHWKNLRVGAAILKELHAQHGHWPTAFKLYHIGTERDDNRQRGNRYASSVLRRIRQHGVDLKATLGVQA